MRGRLSWRRRTAGLTTALWSASREWNVNADGRGGIICYRPAAPQRPAQGFLCPRCEGQGRVLGAPKFFWAGG